MPLTFDAVRRQIGAPCRRPATGAQLDYLAVLIVELSNAGKIRWEAGPGRSYTVYDAKSAITRYKAMTEELHTEKAALAEFAKFVRYGS